MALLPEDQRRTGGVEQDRSGLGPEVEAGGGAQSFWQRHVRSYFTLRLSQEHLIGFCRQLSVLTDIGVPLLKALEIIEKRTEVKALQSIARGLAERIEAGESFSAALTHFPQVFSRFFVNMIVMAELGGVLDRTLHILADYLEKEAEIRQKVRRALMYP
ncbi:MAG: hypothetical protein D6736_08000, partial [Nitrospinota bacterium]